MICRQLHVTDNLQVGNTVILSPQYASVCPRNGTHLDIIITFLLCLRPLQAPRKKVAHNINATHVCHCLILRGSECLIHLLCI